MPNWKEIACEYERQQRDIVRFDSSYLDLWSARNPIEMVEQHLAQGLLVVALCQHGIGRSRGVVQEIRRLVPTAFLLEGVSAAEDFPKKKVDQVAAALSLLPYILFTFGPESKDRYFFADEKRLVQIVSQALGDNFIYLSPNHGSRTDSEDIYRRAKDWALDFVNGEGVR